MMDARMGGTGSLALSGVDGRKCTVLKPYPKEFCDDVVNVARSHEPGKAIKHIAAAFRLAKSCLRNRIRRTDVENGLKPGTTAAENAELREAKKQIRPIKQENEVLRRAIAYPSQAICTRSSVSWPPTDLPSR